MVVGSTTTGLFWLFRRKNCTRSHIINPIMHTTTKKMMSTNTARISGLLNGSLTAASLDLESRRPPASTRGTCGCAALKSGFTILEYKVELSSWLAAEAVPVLIGENVVAGVGADVNELLETSIHENVIEYAKLLKYIWYTTKILYSTSTLCISNRSSKFEWFRKLIIFRSNY